MAKLVINLVVLLSSMCFVPTQSAIPQNRMTLFIEAFRQSVYGSPQLTQVFSISSNSIEASHDFYQTRLNELLKVGVKYPESLSKAIADAVYLTLPLMTPDVLINVTTNPVAMFLISSNMLNFNNAAAYGVALAGTILKNYPVFDVKPSHLAQNRALSAGLYEYLASLGIQLPDQAPLFTLCSAKHFFAMTNIAEPTFEVSTISPPGVIPDAYEVYGVTPFVTAFLQSVDSSYVLQSVFYSNLPTDVVAKAWNDAFALYCPNEKCRSRNIGNALEKTVLMTYDRMSKSTYVKSIASGYALFMLGRGILSLDKSAEQARNVTQTVENHLNKIHGNGHFATRFKAVFEAVKNLLETESNYDNMDSVFFYHVILAFFAATNSVKPYDILVLE